jgi:hypothetical protein
VSKSEREKASRIRGRLRKGEQVPARDRRWLESYDEARRASRAPVEPREPRDVAPSAPAYEPEMVEIAAPVAAPAPAATGHAPLPATSQPVAATGNNVAPGVSGAPGPAGGPLPSFHKPTCPVGSNCPGCAGEVLVGEPPTCITTGRQFYPAMGQAAARGFAGALLFAVSLVVRVGRYFLTGKWAPEVEPTALERSELADALIAAFKTRPFLGQIGHAIGDVVAAGHIVVAYGSRSAAAPLPADAGPSEGGAS